MKKLLLTILVSTAGLGLYSCNNGAYDLDPKDSGGALNPLNPENKVSIGPGNIRAKINGIVYTFYPSVYLDTSLGSKNYICFGALDKDPMFQRWMGMTIHHVEGKDPDFTNKTIVDAWYSLIDTSIDQRVWYTSVYTDAKMDVPGSLKGKEGDAIHGFLPAGEYRLAKTYYEDTDRFHRNPPMLPPIKMTSVKVSEGEFHLKKTTKVKDVKFTPY